MENLLGEHTLYASFKSVGSPSEDGTLSIKGWANRYSVNGEEIVDRDSEVIFPSAYDLSNFQKNPIMLYMHDRMAPIGKVTDIGVTNEGLYIEGEVYSGVNKEVYTAIEKGVLQTFSIGFRGKQGVYNPDSDIYYYTNVELYEVSVVTVPANQDSVFSIVKSPCDGGVCALGISEVSTKSDMSQLIKKEESEKNSDDLQENRQEETIYTLEQLKQLQLELEMAIKAISDTAASGKPETESETNSDTENEEEKEEESGEEGEGEADENEDSSETPEKEEPASSGNHENSSITVAEATAVLIEATSNTDELSTLVEFYEVFTEELNESVEAYLTAESETAEN
jgi:HK97 family phage prohead protease